MNAIQFKEMNAIYKAEGCGDLPARKEEGEIISCWSPDANELDYIRQCIANGETPKIYLSVSGTVQPPVYIGCNIFEPEGLLS